MEGKKNDQGKNRLDLIPAEVIDALGKVLTHGSVKYGDNNWRLGIVYSRVYGAVLRHLNAWRAGEVNDPESGMPHLWHAQCELAFLVTYEIEGRADNLDDIHCKIAVTVPDKEHEDMALGTDGLCYDYRDAIVECVENDSCVDCAIRQYCSDNGENLEQLKGYSHDKD